MSDEQIIYLDPDDELTKVRERLEGIRARRVVLIVPQQTQLRSHVGWRLLHARTREMGKEALVISADRQIRAVAKAAGFRVAESPASSSSSKSRSGSRPSRSAQDTRTGRQRVQQRDRARETRDARRRDQASPASPISPVNAETAEEPRTQNIWEDTFRGSQVNTSGAGREVGTNAPHMPIEDDEFDQPYEYRVGSPSSSPSSPTPLSYAPSSTASPYAPRGSTFEDDEQEQMQADYETSRRIREAAEQGKASPRGESALEGGDPFDLMEDRSSAPLPEQRGSTFVQDVGEDVPDIFDVPTVSQHVHEIEDMGDQGDFVGTQQIPERKLPDIYEPEPEETPPPRIYGSRKPGSRSGTLSRRPSSDLKDADSLAPIEDQPTVTPIVPIPPTTVTPARPGRSSGVLPAARSGSQAAPPPPAARQKRNVTVPPVPQQQSPRVSPRTGAGRTSGQVGTNAPISTQSPRRDARTSNRRGGRALTILLITLLLLFLAGVGVFYFGTSANVTITVPARAVSVSNIKLVAASNPQQNTQNTQNSVASQVLTFNTSASGNGTATGTTKQGNSQATGTVNFTNKNITQSVDIPTGTTVSTSGGAGSVVFATTADAVIPANSSIPIPVQAQVSGPQGNVSANAITAITADGYTKIAQANNVQTSALNLSVTNPGATSGGGAANTPTATKNDIAALKLSLHQKIQAQVKSWLATQLHAKDQRGTLVPDVLGSKNPLAEEILTQAPSVGQPLTSSTISGTLSVQVKVLVVRAPAILAAAQQQLNAYALKQHPAYMLTSPDTVQITKIASSGSKDGSTLTLTLNATGQSVPEVNLTDLSKFLSGKTVDQAKSDIKSGDAGVAQVEDTQVIVTPSFLNLMPFRPEHIHITILPGPSPKGGLPNG